MSATGIPKQFIPVDFLLTQTRANQVLGQPVLNTYHQMRSYIWRSDKQGSRRLQNAWKEKKLVTNVTQGKLAADLRLHRRTIVSHVNILRAIGWVYSADGCQTGQGCLYQLGYVNPLGQEAYFSTFDLQLLEQALLDLTYQFGLETIKDLDPLLRLDFATSWFQAHMDSFGFPELPINNTAGQRESFSARRYSQALSTPRITSASQLQHYWQEYSAAHAQTNYVKVCSNMTQKLKSRQAPVPKMFQLEDGDAAPARKLTANHISPHDNGPKPKQLQENLKTNVTTPMLTAIVCETGNPEKTRETRVGCDSSFATITEQTHPKTASVSPATTPETAPTLCETAAPEKTRETRVGCDSSTTSPCGPTVTTERSVVALLSLQNTEHFAPLNKYYPRNIRGRSLRSQPPKTLGQGEISGLNAGRAPLSLIDQRFLNEISEMYKEEHVLKDVNKHQVEIGTSTFLPPKPPRFPPPQGSAPDKFSQILVITVEKTPGWDKSEFAKPADKPDKPNGTPINGVDWSIGLDKFIEAQLRASRHDKNNEPPTEAAKPLGEPDKHNEPLPEPISEATAAIAVEPDVKPLQERRAAVANVIEAAQARTREQVNKNAAKRQARETRQQNLAGTNAQPIAKTKGVYEVWEVWKEKMTKHYPQTIVTAWVGPNGDRKAGGQIANLVNIYGQGDKKLGVQRVSIAVDYLITNWDVLSNRLFKRAPGLPTVGCLAGCHETLVKEANLWVKHRKTLEEWAEWAKTHNILHQFPSTELKRRYEQAQRDLAQLGIVV